MLSLCLLTRTAYGTIVNEFELDAMLSEEDPVLSALLQTADEEDDEEDDFEQSMILDGQEATVQTPAPAVYLPAEEDVLAAIHPMVHFEEEEEDQLLLANTRPSYTPTDPGSCQDVFVSEKKVMVLYVYIDLCPPKPECELITNWGNKLIEMLVQRYAVRCRVKYVVNRTCKHNYFPPVVEPPSSTGPAPASSVSASSDSSSGSSSVHSSVGSSSHDDDDATPANATLLAETDDESNPFDFVHPHNDEYCFGINFFRGGRGRNAHVKRIIEFEQAKTIFHNYNFFICETEGGCSTDPNGHYLSSLVKVVKYTKLRIVKKFACRSNAVPIEFYDDNSKHKCICRCPAGYVWKNTKCVRMKEQCECKWVKKCYVYKVTDAWTHEPVCNIRNWYGETLLVPIPQAYDNYVARGRINANDALVPMQRPCVQLEVNGMVQDYSWKYFTENRNEIFDNIQINGVGSYELILRAFDYGPIPAVCRTWLAVQDHNRPYSTDSCPSGAVLVGQGTEKSKVAVYSQANFENAQKVIAQFKLWKAGRVNDKCAANSEVDPLCVTKFNYYRQWTFCNETPAQKDVPTCDGLKCFEIFEDDTDWMTRYLSTNLLTSARPGRPKYCKKCCEFKHTFGELFTKFQCNANDAPSPLCCKGDTCRFKQCLQGSSQTFFKANISIKPQLVDDTKQIIALFPKLGYNEETDIHYGLDESCTGFDDGSCNVKTSIADLFDDSIAYATSFFETDIFNNFDVNSLVKWRYKVDGQNTWHAYRPNGDIHTFMKLKSTITLEAWSACGRLCRYTFYIYAHIHREVDICERFAENSFYQSSQYHTNGADFRFCNYPEADFGELTFEFNPQADFGGSHGTELTFNFTKLTCWASFGDDAAIGPYSAPVEVVDWSESSRFLKRFAVNLATEPTTRADTPMKWECEISYKNFLDEPRSQNCSHTFTFCDCEKPGWDCIFGECQQTCPSNPLIKKPNQACGGAQLSWEQTSNVAILEEQTFECCNDCGKSVACESIFNGVTENTICNCKVSDPHTTVLPGHKDNLVLNPWAPEPVPEPKSEPVNDVLADELMTNSSSLYYGAGLLTAMVVAVALIAMRKLTADTASESNDTYHPLI